MTDATQPVAGSLTAVVQRACKQADCPHFQTVTCPDHARTENLGVVASFDYREASDAKDER